MLKQMNLNTIETEIYETINCHLFDNYNLSKCISNYLDYTPLQKAWKLFCIEKNIPDVSDDNDYSIISGITNPNKNCVFQGLNPESFYPYIENNDELIQYIQPYIEEKIDFTYFHASILIAIFGEAVLDYETLHIEKEVDNFDIDDDEKYKICLKNAKIFEFLLYIICQNSLIKLKIILEKNKTITSEVFNRIWERIVS
jgi:hypothetical protein